MGEWLAVLAEATVRGSLLIAVAGLVTWLLRRRAASIRSVVWQVVACAVVALPVLSELVKGHAGLAVVCEVPTHERIAIAVAPANTALRDAIDTAQAKIMADPWFAETKTKWFGATTGATA